MDTSKWYPVNTLGDVVGVLEDLHEISNPIILNGGQEFLSALKDAGATVTDGRSLSSLGFRKVTITIGDLPREVFYPECFKENEFFRFEWQLFHLQVGSKSCYELRPVWTRPRWVSNYPLEFREAAAFCIAGITKGIPVENEFMFDGKLYVIVQFPEQLPLLEDGPFNAFCLLSDLQELETAIAKAVDTATNEWLGN
ncbi:MAG: hypothetical protein HZC02_02010 [Candidatus Levybacteria bacterium]|nr:hypothetical protein [Candidatus Levybacteria bacterium]